MSISSPPETVTSPVLSSLLIVALTLFPSNKTSLVSAIIFNVPRLDIVFSILDALFVIELSFIVIEAILPKTAPLDSEGFADFI